MATKQSAYDLFLGLSVELTGLSRVDLQGTGVGPAHFQSVNQYGGAGNTADLWAAWADVEKRSRGDAVRCKELTQSVILQDQRLGPLARNLLILWYLGQWLPMPAWWQTQFAPAPGPAFPVIASPEAYVEGLVWRVAGTHPPGAKPFGFGVWTQPPQEPDYD